MGCARGGCSSCRMLSVEQGALAHGCQQLLHEHQAGAVEVPDRARLHWGHCNTANNLQSGPAE